jgi:hypothetical protein
VVSKFYGIYQKGSGGGTTIYTVTGKAANAAGIADGIRESIQKPTTYFCTVADRNWLPANQNDLWNSDDNKKTIYDPCPAGWRVPPRTDGTVSANNSNYSPWKGLSGNSAAGFDWGVNALYPAAGQRNSSSGGFFNTGSTSNGYSANTALGCYWTASVTGNFAYNLYFHIDGVVADDQDPRSTGRSIRCIQDR